MQRTTELGLTERRDFYGRKLVGVLFALDFLNMRFPLYGGTVINTYMLKEITMSRSTYRTGFGWTFVSLNTTTAHFFGPAAFAKLNGMVLLLTGVVCAPAGLIGGKLFDLRGNYRAAFRLNMAIAAVGIIAMTFARMPTPPLASAQTR